MTVSLTELLHDCFLELLHDYFFDCHMTVSLKSYYMTVSLTELLLLLFF